MNEITETWKGEFRMKCKERNMALNRVWLATPWTVARQAALSMGSSRREYWRGCHALLQGSSPTQGSNPGSRIAGRCFMDWATWDAPRRYLKKWNQIADKYFQSKSTWFGDKLNLKKASYDSSENTFKVIKVKWEKKIRNWEDPWFTCLLFRKLLCWYYY